MIDWEEFSKPNKICRDSLIVLVSANTALKYGYMSIEDYYLQLEIIFNHNQKRENYE